MVIRVKIRDGGLNSSDFVMEMQKYTSFRNYKIEI